MLCWLFVFHRGSGSFNSLQRRDWDRWGYGFGAYGIGSNSHGAICLRRLLCLDSWLWSRIVRKRSRILHSRRNERRLAIRKNWCDSSRSGIIWYGCFGQINRFITLYRVHLWIFADWFRFIHWSGHFRCWGRRRDCSYWFRLLIQDLRIIKYTINNRMTLWVILKTKRSRMITSIQWVAICCPSRYSKLIWLSL